MYLTAELTDKQCVFVMTALVGRLGSGPLAAVGLSGALFNFCNFLFSFLMIVTTPRVAAAVAQNDLDQVGPGKAFSQLLLSLHLSKPAGTCLLDLAAGSGKWRTSLSKMYPLSCRRQKRQHKDCGWLLYVA